VGNTLNLGTLGGWQQSPAFDSLPGGYYYNLYVNIYPKVSPTCNNGIDSNTTFFQVYVPLACENTGYADFVFPEICKNEMANFFDLSNPGAGINNNITNWFWDFGDGGISNMQHPSHIFSTSGFHNITLTVTTSHGCSFTQSYPMLIHDVPTSAFTYQDNGSGLFSFSDASTINNDIISSWYWNFGDGATSAQQYPTHQYNTSGTYTVCLTTSTNFGCADTICQNISVIITGINDVNNTFEAQIKPNPAHTFITLPNLPFKQIIIYDVTGKEVKRLKTASNNTINISDLQTGIYFIKLINTNMVYDLKFIKE
jgi:PKD repeat protein